MKDQLRRVTAWTLMTLCACSAPATKLPPSASPTVTPQARDENVQPRQPYTLVPLRRPAAADPLPPGFRHTEEKYEEARQAYQKGAFKQAASGFIAAAGLLSILKVKPYEDIAAANRAVLYLDAAYAWVMAGMLDSGLQTLEETRDSGRADGEMLKRAFAVLHSALPVDPTQTMIIDALARVRPNVMYCGVEFRVSGSVKIRLQVRSDGTVGSVTILEAPDAALAACVAQAVRKATFSRTRNGGTFSYPWVFPTLNESSSQQLICAHEAAALQDFVERLDHSDHTISKPWPTGDSQRDHHIDEILAAFRAVIRPEERRYGPSPLITKEITPGELERLYENCPASLTSLRKVNEVDPEDRWEFWHQAIDRLVDCQCRADLGMLKVFYYLIYRGPY